MQQRYPRMQSGNDHDGPGDIVVQAAQRASKTVIERHQRWHGEQAEEGQRFALRPTEQEAQRHLPRQQGIEDDMNERCGCLLPFRQGPREIVLAGDPPHKAQDHDRRQQQAHGDVERLQSMAQRGTAFEEAPDIGRREQRDDKKSRQPVQNDRCPAVARLGWSRNLIGGIRI